MEEMVRESIQALQLKYEYKLRQANVNLRSLIGQGSIPDHTCFVETVDKLIKEIEESESMLQRVKLMISQMDTKQQ